MDAAKRNNDDLSPAAARRALNLISEIDQIRDQIPEPVAMLTAVTTLLSHELQTELCMLMLQNRETTAVELKALHKRNQISNDLIEQITRQLAKRVMALDSVAVWSGIDLFPAQEALHDLWLTAVPIIMGKTERLGGMLLARTRPFSNEEIDLLNLAEDHIDSAVIQGYAYYDMQQRLRELEAIYQIDHIRDLDLPFDDMLNAVLQQLGRIIAAEMGFIMLYDQAGHSLEMRAATHQDLFELTSQYRLVKEIANDSLRQGMLNCRNDLGQPLHSVMCLPLILNDQVIG
ncbi:MAG: GAF domain-containing protein, partial [Anaerolineales bacterium]|nr:GAF domain-containing protein [Anaerolineales bacterium]